LVLKGANPKDPVKLQKAKIRAEFQYIYSALRKKYTVKELAEKTGIMSNNLSSYASGGKVPGKSILNKFYSKMSDEIQELPEPEQDPHTSNEGNESPEAKEALTKYWPRSIEQDFISELKKSNEFLREEFSKVSSTHQQSIAANQTVADACKVLAESNKILATEITNNSKKG
jgi:transcriptional regulator with XRE-family HTH domain